MLIPERVKLVAGQTGIIFSGAMYQYATPLRSEVSRQQGGKAAASWIELSLDADPGVYRQRADVRTEPFAFVLASYLVPEPDPELYDPPFERDDEELSPEDVRHAFEFAGADEDDDE